MKQLEQAYLQRPNAHEVSLQYLNIRDITTMVPKLRRFKFLDSLSLHANNLTFIPSLEILDQLRQLNLTRNPIKIDNKLMDSLFTIPNLEHLSIDIHSEDERQMIIQNLPKLKYLNGSVIQRKKQVRAPKEQEMKKIKSKLSAQEQNVKSLLYTMYRFLDENNQPPDINQQVTFSIKCVIEQFEYFYENITSELARSCVYLYYKHKMYQIVESHLTSFLEDHDHQNIANAIDEMNKPKREGFEEILKVILQYAYEEDFSNKTVQPGNKLRKETLYQNEITRLKRQVADLTKQNQELHQMNEKYIERVYQGKENMRIKENGLRMSRSSRNKSNLPTPTSRRDQTPMSKSNSKKQFTRTPSKSAIKIEIPKTPELNRTQQLNRTPSKNHLTPSYSKKQLQPYRELDKSPSYQVLPRHRQQEPYEPVFNKTNSLGSFSTRKIRPNFSTRQNKNNQNQQELKRTTSKTSLNHEKKLTLDQIVQFIDEFIYEKGKFNLRYTDKGELYQTPQEFLYTYFLRKYGLKDMALQWSLMIIKAIEKYSKENIIVEVFGKILKNNVQEEFYAKCKEFKEHLNPLVPLKQNFLNRDVRQCFFEAFPHEDNESFQKLISKLQGQSIKGEKIYKRRTVLFALESFFVKNHQKDIAKYLDLFRIYDRDDDGLLENQEIERCISNFIKKYADVLGVYQSQENMQNLFNDIMGKRRKKGNMVSMTFSEFVAAMRDCF